MKTEELRRLYIEEKYLKPWTWTSPNATWIWNEDGSIDVIGNIGIGAVDKKLPFKFRNVYGNFDFNAVDITTLEGSPDMVQGYFSCSRCNLKTLGHAPKTVSKSFYCYDNPGNFTTEDVLKVCKVGGDIKTKGIL